MGECIPIGEELQARLTELQLQDPLADTVITTKLYAPSPPVRDLDLQPGLNPATGFITECTNRTFAKLADYYELADDSVWYTASMVLNPTVKFKYLEYQWKSKLDAGNSKIIDEEAVATT